jgi:hypothetical protein
MFMVQASQQKCGLYPQALHTEVSSPLTIYSPYTKIQSMVFSALDKGNTPKTSGFGLQADLLAALVCTRVLSGAAGTRALKILF